jgi:hypothetical protein
MIDKKIVTIAILKNKYFKMIISFKFNYESIREINVHNIRAHYDCRTTQKLEFS